MTDVKLYVDGKLVYPCSEPAPDPKEEPPGREEPPFNAAAFFDYVREKLFDGRLDQGQVDGINLLGESCKESNIGPPFIQQTSYILATVYHETARTMQPIEEWGRGRGMPYYPWYGRGHVQLTWEENYLKQQHKLGHIDEIYRVHDDPGRALIPQVSAAICVDGMRDGDFTGKKLDDYITEQKTDYYNARRIVNGLDRAETIAGYARHFETAFRAGTDG